MVTARVDVSSPDTQVAMHLADLSLRGFAVRASDVLGVGRVMRFRFATPSGNWSASLTAKSVYCSTDAEGPADAPTYQAGFQFINSESPAVQSRIHQLVDHATSAISFS